MWSQARGKQPLFRALGIPPADFSLSMAHGARAGTGNALQLIGGHHHHRHPSVTPSATEIGRQIRCHRQVGFLGQPVGALQHHVTARAFLGVKPEVTTAGLAQRDPVVLAVIPPHLHLETSRSGQFQRLGLVPLTLLSRGAAAFLGLQQLIEFLTQIIEGGKARRAVLPGRAQLILDEGFALTDQLKTLLMVL